MAGINIALRYILAAGLIMTASAAARADDPKSLTCTFKTGSARAFEKGKFKPVKASPVTVALTEIDADKQSAMLPGGKGNVRVVRAVNALHFIEIVGEGFMNLTTVYDKDKPNGLHPAVHSRHFGILGQPIVSHYQGFCEGK
jgi:hypothetical protein